MTAAQQQQLIDDHFLFKEGDRFLEACNLNRDWPEGRGIFHNNEKTFLVWVNEEDQLRIISMQQGADIGAVFTRLSKACTHIESVAKFSHDDHLGYITSCPTNLGTALRASVHIALPKLGAKMADFQKIADEFNVQIRGIHGEHSESADHVYDISNKRRLGRSEVDLVQDMYNGVKAMIAKEKELRGGAASAQATARASEVAEVSTQNREEEEEKEVRNSANLSVCACFGLAFTTCVVYCTMLAFVKDLQLNYGLTVVELSLVRSASILLGAIISVHSSGQTYYKGIKRAQILPLLLRGICGFCAFAGAAMAVKLIPFSIHQIIQNLMPSIVAILACCFLHERITLYELVAIILCFIGVSIVAFGGQKKQEVTIDDDGQVSSLMY